MISAGFDVQKEPYLKALLATIRGSLLQASVSRPGSPFSRDLMHVHASTDY